MLSVAERKTQADKLISLSVGLYNSSHSSLSVFAELPVPAHAISLITTGCSQISTVTVLLMLSLPLVSIALAVKAYVVASRDAVYIVEVAVVLAKEKWGQEFPFVVQSRI